MRVLEIALKSLLSLVVVAVLATTALLVNASIGKQDCFYLRNAELENVDYLRDFTPGRPKMRRQEEQLAVHSHRLKAGSGSVLAYRFYSNGSLNLIDDESYRKLTIWIAQPMPSVRTRISLENRAAAIAIFARGGSAWPRSGCFGYLRRGEVEIVPMRKSYVVRLDAELTPITDSMNRACATETVRLTFEVDEISHAELTPWLGLRGAHPYEETYR